MSAVTNLPPPAPEPPPEPLSKQDLLAALDAQIKFITDDRKRPPKHPYLMAPELS